MNGTDLFVNLVLRLRHYADAAVLWILLKERADVKEFKTTTMLMSHVQLSGTIDRNTAHRAIRNLRALGLLEVRIHAKTATRIAINRQAVLDLLAPELEARLPGLSKKSFPFLDAWAADQQARASVRALIDPAPSGDRDPDSGEAGDGADSAGSPPDDAPR
jgi:hypothetical protein